MLEHSDFIRKIELKHKKDMEKCKKELDEFTKKLETIKKNNEEQKERTKHWFRIK